MSASYYLGIDIGGTKSHALIVDAEGNPVGLGKAGAGNHERVGYSGLAAVMGDITEQALAQAGITREKIGGAGFGLCGYDWDSERAPHGEAIQTLGLSAPVEWVNDGLLGLFAGTDDGWGVSVVAGTSCNCWGRALDGRLGHVIGMGQMVGEAAGSDELVERALWAIAYAHTQAGAPTRLTETFMAKVGAATPEALLEGYCEGIYRFSATDAPLVFAVAQDDDAVAQGLIHWAGESLGELVIAVIRQLDIAESAFDVLLTGSFFRGSPMIQTALEGTVRREAPDARYVRIEAPPVVGAALLGMTAAGCSIETITTARRCLTRSLAPDFSLRPTLSAESIPPGL